MKFLMILCYHRSSICFKLNENNVLQLSTNNMLDFIFGPHFGEPFDCQRSFNQILREGFEPLTRNLLALTRQPARSKSCTRTSSWRSWKTSQSSKPSLPPSSVSWSTRRPLFSGTSRETMFNSLKSKWRCRFPEWDRPHPHRNKREKVILATGLYFWNGKTFLKYLHTLFYIKRKYLIRKRGNNIWKFISIKGSLLQYDKVKPFGCA